MFGRSAHKDLAVDMYWLSSFFPLKIFLILGMSSNFLLKLRHFCITWWDSKRYWIFCFNSLCLTSLQQVEAGVLPHCCQVERKIQVPHSFSIATWSWECWGGGGGNSLSLSGPGRFSDPHLVSSVTTMGRHGLVPTGKWPNTTPIFGGRRKKDTLLLPGTVGSPNSHTLCTDPVEDASSPAGRHKSPGFLFDLHWHHCWWWSCLLEVHEGRTLLCPRSAFAGRVGSSFFCGDWLE